MILGDKTEAQKGHPSHTALEDGFETRAHDLNCTFCWLFVQNGNGRELPF